MNQSAETRSRRLEQQVGAGNWVGAAILAAIVLSWVGISGPRAVEAQQAKVKRVELAPRVRVEYEQVDVIYANMADTLNVRDKKGWEPFQFVPIFPANPGAGGPMIVSIVFRRPAK